jgi:hypothetical protein
MTKVVGKDIIKASAAIASATNVSMAPKDDARYRKSLSS